MKSCISLLFLCLLSACHYPDNNYDLRASNLIYESINQETCTENLSTVVDHLLSEELTASDAVQIALFNNPEIKAIFEEINISYSDLIEAGLIKNPVFEGFVRFPFRKHIPLDTEFTLLQSFIDLLLLPLKQKVALAELEKIHYKVAHTILNIAFEVEETFYSYIGEKKKMQHLKNVIEATDAAQELAYQQWLKGNINKLELQKNTHVFLLSKVNLIQSQKELINLQKKMDILLGTNCWRLNESFPNVCHEKINTDCLNELALEQRFDYQAIQWEINKLSLLLGTKEWWTYSDAAIGPSTGRDTDGIRTWGGAFYTALPIFNYGQADRNRISAKIRQNFDKLCAKEIEIQAEVDAALQHLLIAQELADSYEKQVLLLQKQTTMLSEKYYNFMVMSIYNVINVKVEEQLTEINYANALKDYWLAKVTLKRAVGGNLPIITFVPLQHENPVASEDHHENVEQQKFVPHNSSKLSYNPVITPNGSTLPWTFEDGVKVFHLIAEPCTRQFAPGLVVNCWGYNGQTPGPTIEAVEGDRVRIFVTNHLEEPTTIHWHGIILPNDMDGVSGLNQAPILPGKTFKYEFTLQQSGTFLYHSHADDLTQVALGMMGFFIIHPKNPSLDEIVDRDFAIMLHEWAIPIGGATPNPLVMTDFNYFTFNSTVWPGTEPLVVKQGQKVRIRLGNLSMDSHPIHLHGYEFIVTGRGGKRLPHSAQYSGVTVNVPVGDTRQIEFIANAPGDWAFHCHKTHHTMNGMEHNIPNLIGVNQEQVTPKIKQFFEKYMPMGSNGMYEVYEHHMHHNGIPNFLHPGSPGPCGIIELSGMFTVLKVRSDLNSYEDPGWYNCSDKKE